MLYNNLFLGVRVCNDRRTTAICMINFRFDIKSFIVFASTNIKNKIGKYDDDNKKGSTIHGFYTVFRFFVGREGYK